MQLTYWVYVKIEKQEINKNTKDREERRERRRTKRCEIRKHSSY